MKHIDGRSLDDMLSQHKAFPIPVAQTILMEVARGLDYAHREGVIHRDIKPANIMVDQKGQSIVMDFGIARAAETEHFTQTGATIGTPAYMSPEQCHGAETSAASDQYSLGILAYELLTGAPPFTGTPIELQIAHMQDTPVPIRDRRSELSLELSGAVMRMLLKKPEERWPSLRDLVPIFARGLDAQGDEPRDELIAMVKAGAPRRKSYPATPISPTPLGNGSSAVVTDPARESFATVQVSELSAEPAIKSSAEHEAKTEISGPMLAVSSPASELMRAAGANSGDGLIGWESSDGIAEPDGTASVEGEAVPGGARRGMSARATTIVSAGVVLAVVSALALRGGKRTGAVASQPVPAPVATPSAAAPSVVAPVAVQRLPGDSTAVGLGPAAKGAARGKAPREVTVDAVALLQLTLAKSRAVVGDTVHATLNALDDAGQAVTTGQIVWTTSDASVVRFAGPGQLIAVKAGKATVTVTAGSTTAGRELTVLVKKK